MPPRPVRVDPIDAMRDGFVALRREAQVREEFPPEVEAAARAAAQRRHDAPQLDVPFITIDPPGSRDLDQALHLERRGDGYRVRYAIADVGSFVDPGDAIDVEAHARGVTVYAPDRRVSLHPPVLSEGAASLLPEQWTPAVVWTLDLDGDGELVETMVERAQVRSRAQHTYEDVPGDVAALLHEVGSRRAALERQRGGVQLNVPEQIVVGEGDGWTVTYRVPLATEGDNAQISLLTGIAAARLMLQAGTGILRTQPAPDAKAFERLRRQARALGVDWAPDVPYPAFIAELDPAAPAHAVLLREAAGIGKGARYTIFDGAPPDDGHHFAIGAPYAHATAPLRRLQDRFVSACCLAAVNGEPVPEWVRRGLPALPDVMAEADRRARAVERGVVDLVEAVLLAERVGEVFDGVVIDDDLVQLKHPAVRAKVAGAPEPGSDVRVRLERADPAARAVEFSVVG
jgi:exoribonuclease R